MMSFNQGRIYRTNHGAREPWSFRQIKYFIYVLSKFDLILSVGTYVPKRLNCAPD